MSEELNLLPDGREATELEQAIFDTRGLMISLSCKKLSRYPNCRDIAEEIADQAIFRAFRSITTFRRDATVSSWMYQITFNLIRDFCRKQKRELHVSPSHESSVQGVNGQETDTLILEPAVEDFERQLIVQMDGRWLYAAVLSLPPKQSLVVRLKVLEELTFEEIADKLACPLSTVKTAYYMAITRLKRFAAKGGNMKRIVAPPMWRPKKTAEPKKPKVLIVGSDYFALTTRIDTQVVFWSVDEAVKNPIATDHFFIPEDVTILWVDPGIEGEVRRNLLDQAIVRGLAIWREDMASYELRQKLLPIWADDSNRSMVWPAVDQGPDIYLEREEKSRTRSEFIKQERLEALREAGARAEAQRAEVEAERQAQMDQALQKFPMLDRRVYQSYLRHEGKNGRRMAAVALEFGFPQVNVERIVKRVESMLVQG